MTRQRWAQARWRQRLATRNRVESAFVSDSPALQAKDRTPCLYAKRVDPLSQLALGTLPYSPHEMARQRLPDITQLSLPAVVALPSASELLLEQATQSRRPFLAIH